MLGKVIDDYKLVEFIGKGSFGTVYRAKRNGLSYALKIFNYDYVFQEFKRNGENNRISREIAVLEKVKHINVTKYIDKGSYIDNTQSYLYLVMEYINGSDLKTHLNSLEDPMSISETNNYVQQILSGLDAVHKHNIVHRDLKPENIFVTKEGTIKILDFGLSKLIDYTSITSTGSTVGSPLYMSPEQIRDSKSIDYRSDYYSLGVIIYEMLAKCSPYGDVDSIHQLYYKILNEPPKSILLFNYEIPNYIDNLINSLLSKNNYERPNSIENIKDLLRSEVVSIEIENSSQEKSEFFLRVWNEKSILSDFAQDGFRIPNCVFPINHQDQQKGLLKLIQSNSSFFIDPATTRLAYDSYSEVKGLVALPYAPKGFDRLEIPSFEDYSKIQEYVKLVVEEQLKFNPNQIVAPFHVSNNTSDNAALKYSDESWFSLDVKFLKEARDYLLKNNIKKDLIMGVCIKSELLSIASEREYFINVLSSLPADAYWIYVDSINYDSGVSQIFNYIKTLLAIQNSTGKKVIAGRVGSIGMLLNSFGIYGFESGASRFETFSEDLFKSSEDSYNMYISYYFPDILRSVPILRKDPSKLVSIFNSPMGDEIKCDCPYCKDKEISAILKEANVKKHFLYHRNREMEKMNSFESISERIDYFYDRMSKALVIYKNLGPIFKPNQYQFIKTWMQVVEKLRIEVGV
ncbi:serine/threonine protein kinase [Enterococcus sp. BWT-B8]|uniref:serine/threonine protein kinase n=1 Tax=Enterococcus sp. BWT-B8 TaxID=2885157 RepID=UPI001E30715F|nr:serine/threonine-protein kinase [Enterococcus sp. BWT-B8]MCB5950442.1 serine/threonine protein kinase [Enterococcus sp. BWT-B8]